MKRVTIILSILGIAFISAGLISYENLNPDDLYRKRIIGSWAEGESVYTITTYETEGKSSCKMWKTPQKKETILTEEGNWWIENGRLYNRIHKIDPPLIPNTDKPIVDIIVSISDIKMTLIDESGEKCEKSKVK